MFGLLIVNSIDLGGFINGFSIAIKLTVLEKP